MSTDYNISIYRKQDNKLIGKVLCNMLKNILDSEYSTCIHCNGRISAHNVKFEYNDLHMIDLAVEKSGFSKPEAVVIGDRLYTDIASGVNAGISSIFVLSGEGTLEDLEKSEVKPEFVYKNIREILNDLQK
jgi:phosphoglycolate phosphatase-like HAD superfamily hydrolase